MPNKITAYIRESRDELKKVIWPSRKEATKYTMLVIGISVGTAVFLGALDYGLNIVLEKVINR
ncbi:MAG: preprotein translocase subunit SecE [Patescibacteria group bacterium]|nr:preprotein translocase subunit SecE [Patescibacteria group bacterium]MDD5716098.1 preprotein translocase subunit SecE [Patescibacteria group bacterium]